MDILEDLRWREVIYDLTEGTEDFLKEKRSPVYAGFDPTGPSLHVGHLLPIVTLIRFANYGFQPIFVIGGGTGLIGDPSGKEKERPLLSEEEIERNVRSITQQIEKIVGDRLSDYIIVNNVEWLKNLGFIEFLRDVGKHFTVNYMLQKESVRNRLGREGGISFTEFTYMLLQAYDFLQLYDRYGCRIQIGGSDQWGNITAGIELIRKVRGERAYGLVLPLLTTSSGKKFGKTEAGTSIWLDPERTTPYRFYQFWINTDDRDVIRYLKLFTFLTPNEIEDLKRSLEEHPEKREPHRKLAEEMTRLIHGEEGLKRALRATKVLFGGSLEGLGAQDLLEIFKEVPSAKIPSQDLRKGIPVVEFLVKAGLVSSKGEAKRLIKGGGAYINNHRVKDINRIVSLKDAVEGKVIVLRKGKKHYRIVRVEN
ncbi:MAG: tyrosine--tRNA ligase [Thermotogae bacterium]|nr:tyrosine--tRNA ligase [Thermotogota bacterium]